MLPCNSHYVSCFSFTTLIQLEHISKSQPAWPQRIMGHNTSLSIHSNNHCHGGEDRGFESPPHSWRCNWLRLHPDHRASLWRSVPPSPPASLLSAMTVFQTFVTSSVCKKISARLISAKETLLCFTSTRTVSSNVSPFSILTYLRGGGTADSRSASGSNTAKH